MGNRAALRSVILAGIVVLAGLTSAGTPAAATIASYKTSLVLVSKTSSKVTVFVGGLRKDLALQPTAQVIAVGAPPLHQGEGSSFLYNPGAGKDGLLRYWVSGGVIKTSFTPMPVTGRYQPFRYALGYGSGSIFWYAPGPAADYLWTFSDTGTVTSQPQTVDGYYETPIFFYTRGIPQVTNSTEYLIWYGRGSAPDMLWFPDGDGGHTEQSVSIGGDYTPIYGQFILDDLYDVTDILWYSNTGPSYVWSARAIGSCCTGTALYTSYRVGNLGHSGQKVASVHFHPEDDAGYQEISSLYAYRPGPPTETIWTCCQHGSGFSAPPGNFVSKPGGSIAGDYRIQNYSQDDLLLLDRSTTGQILHLTSHGPDGSLKLTGLPPDPRVAIGSVGIPS